jgi:hypothetical protein
MRQESDLLPFKPRCDVLVTGHAHARELHSTFEVGLHLRPGGGSLRVQLPAHRAFVLADLGGVRLPLPMSIDTLTLDSDTLQLRLVWRVSMLHSMRPETLELRFEVDPKAPLVKYKNMEDPA